MFESRLDLSDETRVPKWPFTIVQTLIKKTLANRAVDSRFVLEAIIKALISELSSSGVIKLMDRT